MAEQYQKPTVQNDEEVGKDWAFSDETSTERHAPEAGSGPSRGARTQYPQSHSHIDPSEPRNNGTNNMSQGKKVIFLKDAVGRKFTFPFATAKTWHGMEELLQQALVHVEIIGPHVKEGHFDLLGPDGSVVLPSVWEQTVEPGWFMTMRMWKDADDDRKRDEEAFKKRALEEAKLKAEEAQKKSMGKDKAPIRFKDAVGRKFSFPFHICQTWQGMEELIKQAFIHVDVIGPHVQAGHYDLIGPSGEIILPSVWEKVIEPDWAVTMHMWPMEQRPPNPGAARRPGFPGGPPPPPGGVRLPLGMAGRGMGSAGPRGGPPPPSMQVIDAGQTPGDAGNKSGKNTGSMLASFFGPPKWKNKREPGSVRHKVFGVNPTPGHNLPLAIPSRGGTQKDDSDGLGVSNGPFVTPVDPWLGPKKPRVGAGPSKPSSMRTPASSPTRSRRSSSSSRAGDDGDTSYSGTTGSVELDAREEAKQKDLIVVCNPQQRSQGPPRAIRQQTLADKGHIPITALDIGSARVYWEGPSTFSAASLELVPLPTKNTPPTPEPKPEQTASTHMKWLHVTKPQLFDTIRYKRRDEEWVLKPGTVLRSESNTSDKIFESACFVSVPTLHTRPSEMAISGNNAEICQERKLREAFDQINPELDQESGVLTYSSYPREALEGGNISIQKDNIRGDDGEQIIQIMDNDRRLFYLPANKCKWASLMKQAEIPSIRVSLDPLSSHDSDQGSFVSTPNSTPEGSDDEASSDKISLGSESSGRLSRHPSGPQRYGRRTNEGQPQTDSGSTTKADNKGFILLSSETTTLNKLNKKVPPFLSWLSEAKAGQPRNVAKGFKEGIIRTELKIIRLDEKAYSDDLLEDLYQAFDATDVYHMAAQLSFDQFEQERVGLNGSKGCRSLNTLSNFSTDEWLVTMEEYFDVSLRVLESFVWVKFRSTLVSKCLGALAMIMKDPTQGLAKREDSSDVDDPDFVEPPIRDTPPKFVISRTRTLEDGVRYRDPAGKDEKCKDCNRGTVYTNFESALAHLRLSHIIGSIAEDRLHYYVVPVEVALLERRREDQQELLQTSRNMMVAILQKLVYIQDGVIYDDDFREQRGLPHQLLDSFRWIVVFICTVPHILHGISWLYKDDLTRGDPKHLTSSKIRKQLHLLSRVGLAAEDQIRKAERALISPTSFSTDTGTESFLVSVGPHYLATQLVCNLLGMALHNQKHAADLYETYTNNLISQIRRRPRKRQILKIGALNDDLDLIRKFYEWQKATLRCFDLVMNPVTYPRRIKHEEREKLFEMEYEVVLGQDARLDKDIRRISSLIESCYWMVEQIRERTEIMKDNQGQVLFIFTTVTAIFLPLSFVASYVSMSGGTTGLDWGDLQVFYWKIAGPLTAGVMIFCLVVAQRWNLLQALPTQWTGKVSEWKSTMSEKTIRCEGTEEEEEGGEGEVCQFCVWNEYFTASAKPFEYPCEQLALK
ncbi:hypothetical protein DL768_006679 [Monosporascus sp. mg162]|nr:hypothetical protein DL768_006679 [Monosporascus sp. mg162]